MSLTLFNLIDTLTSKGIDVHFFKDGDGLNVDFFRSGDYIVSITVEEGLDELNFILALTDVQSDILKGRI